MTSEAVGSLADEAAKLFGAAEEWCRERLGPVVADIGAHQGPECRVCPVCQVLALLRGTQPEVFDHLVDAVGSLLAAAQAAVDGQRARRAPAVRIDVD